MNMQSLKILLKQLVQIYKARGIFGLIRYLFNVFIYRIVNVYFRGSYSQKGEDLIINKYFKKKKRGFYIDIGAYDPKRLNNTNYFYQKGWHGVNIEPNPTRIKLFDKVRKRDINLKIGIGPKRKIMEFYMFEGEGISTFSEKEANSLSKVGYKIKQKIKVPIYRLEQIMKKYAKADIDFISIDTEGMEIEVLKSNNWKKFRPKLLCIETIDFIDLLATGKETANRKKGIDKYLKSIGYREYCHNELNTIYENDK